MAVLTVGGGIYYMEHGNKQTFERAQEVVEDVVESVPHEPTEEEMRLAELMEIKEQEAKLEVKRDMQKEEQKVKVEDYKTRIASLQKEYDTYVASSSAEIKSTEAELANFIKATSMLKN